MLTVSPFQGWNSGALWAAVALLLTRASAVYTTFFTQKTLAQEQMSKVGD